MIEISYTTEISKPYVKGIQACSSKEELFNFVNSLYKEICHDALEKIISSEFSWKEYQRGCKLERKGKYAGDEWAKKYGAILMPEIILFIGMKAQQFHAPEGLVFIRLQEFKALKRHENGIYWLDIPREK